MTTLKNQQSLRDLGISVDQLRERNLQHYEEANSLQLVEIGDDNREHFLIEGAAAVWVQMKQAAYNEGISIFIVSAFRSIDRQEEIIRQKLEAGQCIEEIISVCAPPGFSEHHTGRAIDISTPGVEMLHEDFENTTAFKWLNSNAKQYGFSLSYPKDNKFGYKYEPWHWCYGK
jgi:zinc D-Ala-D-Ala carboxypeptidase